MKVFLMFLVGFLYLVTAFILYTTMFIPWLCFLLIFGASQLATHKTVYKYNLNEFIQLITEGM